MRPADGRQADFSLRCLKVNLRLLRAFDQEVVFRRGGQKAHGCRHAKAQFPDGPSDFSAVILARRSQLAALH
jgi:hypothetical protein